MNNKEKLQHMPQSKAFIDDIRKHLGDPVRIEAEENGHRISWTKPEHISVFVKQAIDKLEKAA